MTEKFVQDRVYVYVPEGKTGNIKSKEAINTVVMYCEYEEISSEDRGFVIIDILGE